MRKTILTSVPVMALLAVVSIAPAYGGDIYRGEGQKDGPYAPTNWTGFYLGVNGGYAWNGGHIAKNIDDYYAGNTVTIPVSSPDPAGGFGGGQIGYNWQRDRVIFGVEADIQGAGISDKASTHFAGGTKNGLDPYDYSSKFILDYFGTVRGRLGYASDTTLVYFTGGFAYGEVNYKGNATFTGGFGPAFSLSKDATLSGYVLGGGIEHKLSPGWSVKAEYQYINLGTETASGIYFCCSSWSNKTQVDSELHTVRVGLNYHLGQGSEPMK